MKSTLLREDIKCTFCTFVSDVNEFKNDAYNYSINKRQVLFVLSLHRKHSWKTNFEAEHVVANVWCSTIWIRKTNIADVNSLLCYFDFGTFAGILYLKTGFRKCRCVDKWVCLKGIFNWTNRRNFDKMIEEKSCSYCLKNRQFWWLCT